MFLYGVLIDFGNTLAYIDKGGNMVYKEELLSVVRKYGYQKNLNNLDSVLSDTLGRSHKGELKNVREFWKLFSKRLGIKNIQETLLEELEGVRKNHLTVVFKLYNDVFQVLAALRKKYKLALVSNCAIGTSDVITALGLGGYFETIVLSYEVGVRKPDQRIYLEALRKLRLKPEICVFVADEISDLEGAREVGLKTLLVRQGSHTTNDAKNPNFEPDYQCNHIEEIMGFL